MKLTIISRQDKQARELRKDWFVPGIIYGKHIESAISIACNKNEFIKIYKEAGYSTPITLSGLDKDQLVLIQDIQTDPVSDVLLHVDFLAVKSDEKVTTEIPLKLTGESPLEKLWEGKIQLLKDFVEVEAFPQDLPHEFMIDISMITDINTTIFVKDLKVSTKVEMLDDPEQAIVTVLSMAEEETESSEAPAASDAAATPAKEEKKEDNK